MKKSADFSLKVSPQQGQRRGLQALHRKFEWKKNKRKSYPTKKSGFQHHDASIQDDSPFFGRQETFENFHSPLENLPSQSAALLGYGN